MAWRFIATRLDGLGGDILIDPDLPLTSVSMTHVLSGPDKLAAKIAPEASRLIGSDGTPVFTPWSTAIYAEKDGLIRMGGILTSLGASGETLDLECTGFTGYLQDMPYIGDYRGYKKDPMELARIIWNHVQKQPYGNLGLLVRTNTTPVRIGVRGHPALRGRPVIKDANGTVVMAAQAAQPAVEDQPFELSWYATSNLAEPFEKLAEQTPFDYVESHSWRNKDKCEIAHYLDIRYPKIGRKRSDLRFVVGENVYEAPKLVEDGGRYASDVLILGAGEGSKMVHAISTDHSSLRLRRVAVIPRKGIGRATTAINAAKNEIKHRVGAVDFDEITVIDSPFARYGDLQVGDEIYIQAGHGWYRSASQWGRVVEITITPDKNDNMRILLFKEDEN